MPRKSIGILSTGGTISMRKTAQGYVPEPEYLAKAMANIPELNNEDMPYYSVSEFSRPLDSSNMTPDDWYRIAEHIKQYHDQLDGFVILHGTDTMAYTASALSFMLEHLKKPVIVTGSQLPLFETRSDARENLINAMLIAGHYSIPEVCVYFSNKLFRGNRCKKMDASSFQAFDSPNFSVLGKVGTDIRIRKDLLLTPDELPFSIRKIEPVSIGTLRLFPGISVETLRHFLRPPLKALILETYGVGTAPSDPAFLDLIREAAQSGFLIVNCSQCLYAKVKMRDYATGTALMNAGVIGGGDMTIEAAITKLFYLFSKQLPLEEIKQQMMQNLRGELTL